MKLAIRSWKGTFATLCKSPVIFVPFLVVGLFDVLSLLLIYVAPQSPFSKIFAPPIRAFWGERFLHYPLNFVLMPKLFSYAHIVTTGIIGVLMTGLVIGMLKDIKEGTRPGILFNFIYALKRYFAILVVWLIMFILSTLVYKIPPIFLTLNNRLAFHLAFYLGFLIVAVIQVIFIYAIPAAIVEKRGLITALKTGILFAKQNLLTTFVLILIPSLFYIPVIVLKEKSVVLMRLFYPEVVLIILGIGIIITVLIDFIITCSTTTLFLNQRRV